MKKQNIICVIILLIFFVITPFVQTINIFAQTGSLNGSGGGIIAFTSDRDGQKKIYFMNADGSSQMRITNTTSAEYSPRWSPDGSILAYRSKGSIYIVNIINLAYGEVGEPQLFISMAGASYEWTPDGRIIFDSSVSGNWDIYLVDMDGNNLVNITNKTQNEYDPDVSPDGSTIVYVEGMNLYTMNIDGSNRRQISDTHNDFAPAWSPDGSKIALISSQTGQQNLDICIVDTNGTNRRWVAVSPYLDEFPSWSPDGSKITYECDKDHKEKIYVINTDGTNATQLTNTDYNDGGPDWYPVSISTSINELPNNSLPRGFRLLQNYPNPFNSSTKIIFDVPEICNIELSVFDIQGELIKYVGNKEYSKGSYTFNFNSTTLSSGIYYLILNSEQYSKTIKMLLLK